MPSRTVRLGTRGSALAVAQARMVAAALSSAHPELDIKLVVVRTTGDVRLDLRFQQVGARGMFVREIEDALRSGAIDLGVHSMKDLPSLLPPDLIVHSCMVRADPRDALISRSSGGLRGLPSGARVGSSSPRRQALLRAARPDLKAMELRGNLDTRLSRLDGEDLDGIVLAAAGLERLGRSESVTELLPIDQFLPAAGQGALALEALKANEEMAPLCASLIHSATELAVCAERACMAALGGGCSLPAAAYALVEGDRVLLRALVASADGARVMRRASSAPKDQSEELGRAVARALLTAGAGELLEAQA